MAILQQIEAALNQDLGEQLFSLEGVDSKAPPEWPRMGGFTKIKVKALDFDALAFAPYILSRMISACREPNEEMFFSEETPTPDYIFERKSQWWSYDYQVPGLLKNKDNGVFQITGVSGEVKKENEFVMITNSFSTIRYRKLQDSDLTAKVPTLEARKQSAAEFAKLDELLRKKLSENV